MNSQEKSNKLLDKLNRYPSRNSILEWTNFKKHLGVRGYYLTLNLSAIPYSNQSKNKKRYRTLLIKQIKRHDLWLKRCSKNLKGIFADKEIKLYIVYYLGTKYKLSDIDNLLKITLDCLKNNLFGDDSKIKEIRVSKEQVPKQKYRELKEQTIIKIGFADKINSSLMQKAFKGDLVK